MTNHKSRKSQPDFQDSPEFDRAWSEISDELPPMSADSTILSKARQEVSTPPRRVGLFPSSWVMPVGSALAAGLVIGVAITTLKQQPNTEVASTSDLSETAAAQSASNYSLAPPAPSDAAAPEAPASTEAAAAARSISTSTAVVQSEEQRDESLITPLERSIPRAPAADSAIALDQNSTRAMRKAVQASAARAPVPGSTLPNTLIDQSAGGQSGSTATVIAAATTSGPGNSPEAISDTLTEMLDEISDANGELDDRELDLLFNSQDSWLISIARLVTNRNEKRALQLAGEFRQRFPDAAVPEHLQGLFSKL